MELFARTAHREMFHLHRDGSQDDDFSIKRRKGAQYDVLDEDLGLDKVQTLDPATLFRMLSDGQADSELVTNALQGLIF